MIDINANCYVAFDEAAHKYTDLENEHYISATQFLEKFHSKFEDVEDFWLIYKSIQYCSNLDKVNKVTKFNEELNDLVEEFLIENIGRHYLFTEEECQKYTRTGLWKFKGDPEGFLSLFSSDHCIYVQHVVTFIKSHWKKVNKKATTRGTAFHNEQENISFSDGKFEFRDTIFSTCCNVVDLANLTPNTLYPELRLYNKKYKVAGTSDQVLLNSENKIIIRDYKGLALDTPIATKNGWKNMGDLTLQDEIFDGNGKLTKIKNISEVHYNPCYKLTFDTNDTLIADHEHRWVVIKNNEEVIMTTEEINQYNTLNKDKKRLKIELCPLECEEQDLEIDPYLLGLWLGDGNRTCGTITIENNDIIDGLKSRGHVLSSNHSRNNDKAASYTIYGLAKHLRKLGLIGNKHIPDKYLRGSYEQRLLLLQGFMDADGYFNPIRNRCYTSTTKLWQVESFMTLVSSLGLKPTMNRFKTSGFGKTNIEAFSTEFTGSINPFLFRNKNIKLSDNKRTKYRYINKAELIETVPTKCLEVESESHTYLAGKTYIKTHNTNCEIKTSNKYENFFEPISHLQVCEYTKYSLQLSLYAWMLEQFGYEIDHIEFIHHTLDDNNKSIASKIYKCPYLKDEIEKMLEHYKNSF